MAGHRRVKPLPLVVVSLPRFLPRHALAPARRAAPTEPTAPPPYALETCAAALLHTQLFKVRQPPRLDSLLVLALPLLLRCQPLCLATLLSQAFSFELCGTVGGANMSAHNGRLPNELHRLQETCGLGDSAVRLLNCRSQLACRASARCLCWRRSIAVLWAFVCPGCDSRKHDTHLGDAAVCMYVCLFGCPSG